MKEIKCAECGEVVIILATGSKVKSGLTVTHDYCPLKEDDCTTDEDELGSPTTHLNGAERFRMKAEMGENPLDFISNIFDGK